MLPRSPYVRTLACAIRQPRSSRIDRDRAISERATRQHGLITHAQLRALGVSDSGIARRIAAGRLHRLQPRVYAVGHASPSFDRDALAAVLTCGGQAAVAGLGSAWLLGFHRAVPPRIEVVTTSRRRAVRDATVHWSRSLPASDICIVRDIPVTTVARTFVDLADQLDELHVVRLMHEAAYRRKLNLRQLEVAAERHSSRHGHPTLVRSIELYRMGSSGARSRLELRIVHRLRASGVSQPRVNHVIPEVGFEVDCWWPALGLVVEIDGPGHERPATKLDDQQRAAFLRSADLEVMRISHRTLERDLRAVIERVARG